MKLRVYPQIHSNENWWRPPKSLHGRGQGGDSKPNWKQAALMEHDVRVRRALDDGLVDSAVDRSRWSLERDFVEIVLQSYNLSVPILRHAAQLRGLCGGRGDTP